MIQLRLFFELFVSGCPANDHGKGQRDDPAPEPYVAARKRERNQKGGGAEIKDHADIIPFHEKLLHFQYELFFLERSDLCPEDPDHEEDAEHDRHQFSNREGEPYQVEHSGLRKQKSARQQHDELADQRHFKRKHTMPERLERTGTDDRNARDQKVERNDLQCRNADREHRIRRVEDRKQVLREQLESRETKHHHTGRIHHGQLDRFDDPFRFSGPEIVGNDRNETVVHSEDRHEYETLQFEVHAEYGCSRR